MTEWRKLKKALAWFLILATLKNTWAVKRYNKMNKHFLKSDTKDSAVSQENVVNQQPHLQKQIKRDTKTVWMMTQMLDSMKVESSNLSIEGRRQRKRRALKKVDQ